jgi:uncharacterized protein (TIGR01244 family)
MADIRFVNAQVSVAPQITVQDMPAIQAAGFVAIVNNRPDDEEYGQPSGAEIRAAAEAAGLGYTEIPVTQAGFSHPQIDAMTQALAEAGGPLLAFCRSGTRSCNLWALAAAKGGEQPDAIESAGRGAGYDLSGMRPLLDTLAAG